MTRSRKMGFPPWFKQPEQHPEQKTDDTKVPRATDKGVIITRTFQDQKLDSSLTRKGIWELQRYHSEQGTCLA